MLMYTFVVSFVFVNLFIGVILEGFDLANESFGVSDEDFVRFSTHWSEYDPEATCYIQTKRLSDFVRTLHLPLGFGNQVDDEEDLTSYLNAINIEATSFAGRVPPRGHDFEKHHHTKHLEFTDSSKESKVHFKAWQPQLFSPSDLHPHTLATIKTFMITTDHALKKALPRGG